MLLSSILVGGFALLASGMGTEMYTEPKTKITFASYLSTPYIFGIALPEKPGNDFVGIIVGKGTGYVGSSFGGPMLNALLLAVWPNGSKVMASFRKTKNYGSPTVATGDWSMKEISAGTYVNSTHFVYTFLCQNCMSMADGSSFSPTDPLAVMGFAISTAAPTTKTSLTTAFPRHSSQGSYQLDVTKGYSSQYASWAALANGTKPAVAFRA
ncbi:hypothetical protein BGZ60DRAFT_428519 [Tricladium varicosporioides]|nr:hypothetical protein BGZ60DRAFT_428519 [Hymenoscyphus varicosporioides]